LPRARLIDGELVFDWVAVGEPSPVDPPEAQQHAVTRALLDEIRRSCEAQGVEPVMACLFGFFDGSRSFGIDHGRETGWTVYDLRLPLNRENTWGEVDSAHFNAAAQQRIAESFDWTP
jgi:hypothetical protein